LKAETIKFLLSLPKWKTKAIDRVEFLLMSEVILF